MKNWKKALRFALCLLPVGLIGGWFAAEMNLPSVAPDALETAVQQVGSLVAVKAITTVSSAVYTVICGFFGFILAEKIGLMLPFSFQKATLIRVLLISAFGGAILSLDAWTFANWIPQLKDSYTAAGSFDVTTWIASILSYMREMSNPSELAASAVAQTSARRCVTSSFIWRAGVCSRTSSRHSSDIRHPDAFAPAPLFPAQRHSRAVVWTLLSEIRHPVCYIGTHAVPSC